MWALLAVLLLQATDFNAEGRKALEARDYQRAAEWFEKAAQADPSDYTAHFHLGLAYSMLRRDAQGIVEYRKVLELKPGLYEAELNLGILLLRDKQAGEAASYLEKAVEKKPQEFRPRYYWAEALAATGAAAKAEEQYKLASGLDGRSAAAELGLGRVQARQGRLEEAAPHFRKAAELDAGYRDALLELAGLLEKSRPTEAIALYERFPENAAAQERMGELLLEVKRTAEAIPRLELAMQKDPTPANRLALATAYLFHKQLDKALPLLEQSVAAEPGNYDIRMMYARALRDEKKYAPAAQQFYQAVKLQPQKREAWSDLAGMLYLLESYPQALAALDRARQLGEETPGQQYLRAIMLDRMHDYKPALESYQHFLALSQGKNPDEEFKARQRVRIIQKELSKR